MQNVIDRDASRMSDRLSLGGFDATGGKVIQFAFRQILKIEKFTLLPRLRYRVNVDASDLKEATERQWNWMTI